MGGICSLGDDSDDNTNYKNRNTESKEEDEIADPKGSMRVGIFFDTFAHNQWQTAVVSAKHQNVEESEEEKRQLKVVAIQYWSLVAKVCRADRVLSEPEAAYIRTNASQLGLSAEEIEEALKGNANIEEYPFDENNPFTKYESLGNKTLSKERVFGFLLMSCIIAAAQDGLSALEIEAVYAYTDALKLDRSIADVRIQSLKLERKLYMQWKEIM